MAKKSKIKKTKTELSKLNETGNREKKERRQANLGAPEGVERRKGKRRRQIDPTTCERDYDNAEIEFMHALDEYKRASGRMFPTCSEILEVLVKIGYRKVAEPQTIYDPNEGKGTASEETLDSVELLEEEVVS